MTKIAAELTEPAPLRRVLDAVRAIAADWVRADALTTIAVGLTDPTDLEHAADIARGITESGPRARALAAVAVRMAEPARTNVLDEALDTITSATRQPWDQMRALRAMAAEAAGSARQSRVINAALAITDGKLRWEALVAVADQLPEPTRTQVLEHAATAARAVSDWDRTQKLAAVAARLTGASRALLLDEILDDAATTTSDMDRAHALVAVADQLTEPAQLDRSLTAALACVELKYRAEALAAVAARLTEPIRTDLQGKALDAAIAVPKQQDRAWALYGVAKRLTESNHLDRAVEAAFAIDDSDWVFAVSSAARGSPEPQRDRVLARALDRATSDTKRPGPAERQFAAISEDLTDPDHLGRALGVALGLEPDPFSGSGAWTAVFRRVARLATDIPPKDVVRLLRQAFHTLPRSSVLLDVIGAAAPATARVGGQEALIGQLDLII